MNRNRITLATGLLLSLFALRPSHFAFAQCFPDTLLQSIPNPGPAVGDNFGYSVAIDGNRIVAGVPSRDIVFPPFTDVGVVHVFDATTGAYVVGFDNPSPGSGDNFGRAVAISGNLVVVAAYQDDTGATDAGAAYVFNAMTMGPATHLINPDPTATDQFGWSVAISGNLAVVGAWLDDAGATNAGTAYVFNATTGALTATLSNPDPTATDLFGVSVAISGNLAVVGAHLDDAGASEAGTAYVFNATTGALTATLSNPDPTATDLFGWSVAISGNVALVGAYRDDAGATDAGTAYVFNATTGALTATLSNPAPAADDQFGYSVAISGNAAVVGAYQDDAGAAEAGTAYVFDATTGALKATLAKSVPAALDFFGGSVAISGNVAVVGAQFDDAGASDAGSAYTFSCTPPTPSPTASPTESATPTETESPSPTETESPSPTETESPTASPTPTPTASPTATPTASATPTAPPCDELVHTFNNPSPAFEDHFGSVAISGNSVLVGAHWDNTGAAHAGSAYLFDGVTGALLRTFNNPAPATDDNFGLSVAIDGNRVLVGTGYDDADGSEAGIAYLFDAGTGALLQTFHNPTPAVADYFGTDVAISGSNVLVGAYLDDTGANNAGCAYLFDAVTGSLLHTLNNPSPEASDVFGSSLAISGNNILVGGVGDNTGANDAGSAYLFDAATGALLRTFNNPLPAFDDRFGWSVAVSGNYVLVGALLDDTTGFDAGSAYLFSATTGALLRTLDNPTPGGIDLFGVSVGLSGNNAFVGASQDDGGATDAGSVYRFDTATGSLLATYGNPAPGSTDIFGFYIAVSGTNLLAGAYQDDTGATDAGSAYLFSACPPLPPPNAAGDWAIYE